jgi:splicing factor 3A subunit 3
MESLLEIQRRCHEERERLIKLMVDEFIEKKPSDKDKIFSDHRVKIFLDVSFVNLIKFYQNLIIFTI